MPKYRYFLEASNFNVYNHKEKRFGHRKEQVNALRWKQAWHGSKRIKSPAWVGQNEFKKKVWEVKLRSRQAWFQAESYKLW